MNDKSVDLMIAIDLISTASDALSCFEECEHISGVLLLAIDFLSKYLAATEGIIIPLLPVGE